MKTTEKAGWASPVNSRKAHYFTTDGISLCRKWAFTGELESVQEMGVMPGKNDCADCWRKAKAIVEEPKRGERGMNTNGYSFQGVNFTFYLRQTAYYYIGGLIFVTWIFS